MLKLFVTQDLKANLSMPPFAARTNAEAIRSFTVAVNEGESVLRQFPEEFRLLCIGEFDENTCVIKAYEQPEPLGIGSEFVRRSPVQDQQTEMFSRMQKARQVSQ